MLRLSIITDTFPPEINGVAMSLHQLATGMLARGHEVEVVRPARHRAATRATAPPYQEERVRSVPLPGYSGLRLGLPQKGRLLKKWTATRPDVVYVATEAMLGYSAVAAANQLGIGVISGFHTHFEQYASHYHLPLLEKAALGYLRRLHNRTAMTLAPTAMLVDELRALGFENTHPLGRGVDTDLFHPDRRSRMLRRMWGVAPGEPVALYVGRVAAEKNLPMALGSLARLRAAHPDLHTVVVGDGPARRDLETRHPNVIWAGEKRGEELAAYYASADLFAFPSESETYGNVVAEAMASGLVPVSYRLAAAAEIIENFQSGFLAEPGDALSFRRALRRALSRRRGWGHIREAARRTAERLTWEHVFDQFESYLLDVAAGAEHRHEKTRPGAAVA